MRSCVAVDPETRKTETNTDIIYSVLLVANKCNGTIL